MAYLDHAATTTLLPEVKQLMQEQLGAAMNPSSLHSSGRSARRLLEEARERIAQAFGVSAGEIHFTSGGTESNNIAVKGMHWARAKKTGEHRILVSAIEHHAVLDPAHWLSDKGEAVVDLIPVDNFGRIDLTWLADYLSKHGDQVSLISVMMANNEVGTIQPIAEVVSLASEYKIPVHTDAVQAVGTLLINLAELKVAALSMSGHKVGALHGTGLIMLRNGNQVDPILHGGNQERDVRSGTINTVGAQALALAVELAMNNRTTRSEATAGLRDKLVKQVIEVVPDAVYNGDPINRLPGNAHFSFYGAEGEAMLMLLDAQGVQVSTGAACSVGIAQPSHVLIAMGVDPVNARSSLRFSLGANTTDAEVEKLVSVLPEVVSRARAAGMSSEVKTVSN
ncbi:MAG: hypothetical protein RIT32_671 [Actinomycetota bacterium]|jgi:cysteine desulfurase